MIRVELSGYQVQKCKRFAEESAKSQQRYEFGNHQTEERSYEKIYSDTLTGKIAEVAVVEFFRAEYGLHLPVNFEVYPRGEWDDQDIEVKGLTIDVKGSNGGKWLLFEQSKYKFRREEKTVPDMIIFCRCFGSAVKIAGCISENRLFNPDGQNVLYTKMGRIYRAKGCSFERR